MTAAASTGRIASNEPVLWRRMRDADVADVAALEKRIHAAPWTAGNFRDACAAGNLMLLGETAGAVVAYGVVLLGPDEAELLNISVRPESRESGLGRALLRRFIKEGAQHGALRMFLEVRASNAVAMKLYESEGFVAIAVRAGYYPSAIQDGPREDAVVMQRTLEVADVGGDLLVERARARV